MSSSMCATASLPSCTASNITCAELSFCAVALLLLLLLLLDAVPEPAARDPPPSLMLAVQAATPWPFLFPSGVLPAVRR